MSSLTKLYFDNQLHGSNNRNQGVTCNEGNLPVDCRPCWCDQKGCVGTLLSQGSKPIKRDCQHRFKANASRDRIIDSGAIP